MKTMLKGTTMTSRKLNALMYVTASSVLLILISGAMPTGSLVAGPHTPFPTIVQERPAPTGIYTCPMHPSVRQEGPGRCPICGMDLTPADGGRAPDSADNRAVFHVSPAKQQAIGVIVDSVLNREMKKSVRVFGNIAEDERRLAVVNLRYSGWIDTLAADYNGKFVRRGDLLFRIYSPEALAAQREHLLSGELASDTTWTVDGMVGPGGFGSATRDRLAFLGFSDGQIDALERAGEPSRSVDVLSPVSGHVVEKMATAGMFVEPGMSLYTIADLSTVWLNVELYQNEIPDVRVGQKVVARFGQIREREFSGTVTFIQPTLDRSTRSVTARIEIPNPDGDLKPGMFGDARIATGGKKRLSVPVNAVINTGTREIAFVALGGDRIEARIVRTGHRNDDFIEVLDGLHAGERVISSANFLIDAESRIQGVLDRLQGSGHRHGKDRQP